VGIGASAGGLGALQQFLSHVPPDSGMAIIIVQHLDPDREGMLVELLQRHSDLPVVQASDQMVVQPDHVYVIPPGRDLTILHGALQLLEPPEPRGLRLPIDTFFKSLAQDRQEHSVGVILSGMGSDGTLGLRAIRQAAGACFVQTPALAQFDSMPRSAIDSGVADVIAPTEELPARILAFIAHARLGLEPDLQTELPVDQKDTGLLDKIILQLRNQTGHDFSQYKKSTLTRRIERRMGLHQLARLGDYLRYLRENPPEGELLFNELLIGVTSFFRDPDVWDEIRTEVIPALLARYPDGAALRAWTPGCSTGEEAYSLAMVFKEALEAMRPPHRYALQIFASDLDKEAIATARTGVYPRAIAADLSEQRLNRYFVEDLAGYRVCNEVREMVVFAEQNIIADPPFTKLDLLSCRNLLIYLESGLQGKLIQLFHYSLNPGGVLVLGSAESISTGTALFAPLPGKSRIFRRLDAAARVLPPDFPSAFGSAGPKSSSGAPGPLGATSHTPNLQALVERTLLQRYAPAAVLVSGEGDLLYVSGRTGKYLEPSSGRASLNLFAMAREGLRQALSETFHLALLEQTVGTLKGVKLDPDDPAQRVDVTVQPLPALTTERAMALVVFVDAPAPARRRGRAGVIEPSGHAERLEALAHELLQAREEAKSTREEMQTSQEELKSTNEELQSTNEELQSTNEELTTSKEEMQSMNEELQTVNHELQAKLTELSRASNDMKNLLDSTEIATLFLDDALKVRRFTTQTTRLIKLIAADTGRPITDIVTNLDYPEMTRDAQEVLRTLVFLERDVPATQGRWYKVRTMPYRTQDNRIDGLVIIFTDITANKTLESQLRAAQARLATLGGGENPQGVADDLS
jgi:two-component system CheB/CheR fusion protein